MRITGMPYDDYSITALQESFSYYAKNGQNHEYKQRQTNYSFFYFSNKANNKIDRPMLENILKHQIREFL